MEKIDRVYLESIEKHILDTIKRLDVFSTDVTKISEMEARAYRLGLPRGSHYLN